MTLYTVSETWARCDGTITAACDVYHPDTPHACPAQILCPPGSYVIDTLTPAGWLTIDVGPARRHYCPAHHDQAPRP